jgi:hypothetical protein
MARATENEVAFAIVQIAKGMTNAVATFHKCRREVGNHLNLSGEDRKQSTTRPNEEMWEQQIRNIKSHWEAPGNYIYEGYLEHVPKIGYKVTMAGKVRKHP